MLGAAELDRPGPTLAELAERQHGVVSIRQLETTLGYSRWTVQREANGDACTGFELDVYWPEHRFAVELDTYATHGTNAAFERDHLRDEDLKLAGIELIRVTDVRFHGEREAVLARVAMLLARRADSGVSGRAGTEVGRT